MSTSAKPKKTNVIQRSKKLKHLVEISPNQMAFDFYLIPMIAYSEIITTGKDEKKSSPISRCKNISESMSTSELEHSH